jgi:hypothetical protein
MNQSGGGKFSPEFKGIYLEHCRLIILDGNIASRDFLLNELKEDVIKAINEKYAVIKDILLESVKIIFTSINLEDKHSVGVVNVVSLQCATLFTYACLPDFRQPTKDDFFDLNDLDHEFLNFTNNVSFNELLQNEKKDWRYYNNINKTNRFLRDLYGTTRMKDDKEIHVKPKGIITILDYLTMDEIMIPYLNNWYICGLVYEKTYADGRLLLPFGFTEHDITHYENYNGGRGCYDKEGMIAFLDYINRIEDKETKRSVKMIFFLNLHEVMHCPWDRHFDPGDRFMSRLNYDQDLGLNIPSKHRANMETRNEYIANAITNYNENIDAFLKLGKGIMSRRVIKSKKGKGKKKKNKFSKRRKTQLKEDK